MPHNHLYDMRTLSRCQWNHANTPTNAIPTESTVQPTRIQILAANTHIRRQTNSNRIDCATDTHTNPRRQHANSQTNAIPTESTVRPTNHTNTHTLQSFFIHSSIIHCLVPSLLPCGTALPSFLYSIPCFKQVHSFELHSLFTSFTTSLRDCHTSVNVA